MESSRDQKRRKNEPRGRLCPPRGSFFRYSLKKNLAGILTAAGTLAFFLHARFYALTQFSVLDEGDYLIKGLIFFRGEFAPFEDYGPETNHMPLSFLIHGAVQALFGPGLREGRYFALGLGLLLALGLFLLVRRLRGPWWGAAAVWLLAINPATARFYSLATSQAMIAAMLIWVLVLVIPAPDEKGIPLWRTTVGAALAAVMFLTRINLAPVLALVVPYIFWISGRKAGWWALGAGSLVLGIGHGLLWPDILKIWTFWLPEGLTPFLDPWRRPAAPRFWDPQVNFSNRLFSFLDGMRLHFFSVMGLFLAPFLRSDPDAAGTAVRKTRIFLIALYAVLLVEHMVASLALDYCVYCFPVYMSFFAPVGLVLLTLVLPASFETQPAARRVALAAFILIFTVLLGFGAHDDIGDAAARLRVPRLRAWLSGEPAPGLPVWDVLQTRFGWDYTRSRRVLPAAAGALTGLAVVSLAAGLQRRTRFSGATALHLFLLTGVVLTPTAALGNGFRTYDCGRPVLAHIEVVGTELAERIPPGTQVFWKGGDSAVPMLYVPGVEMYLPQINGDYNLFDLDDADALLRFGLYNDALFEQWLREAGVVLVESAQFEGDLRDSIEAAGLRQTGQTAPPYPCLQGSEILVFNQP